MKSNSTNESGFSALASGFRDTDGRFVYLGSVGYFWTASELDTLNAWARLIDNSYNYVSSGNPYYRKSRGFAIRCLRD
jgi:uncharacterized protein (TIGR02145 family)